MGISALLSPVVFCLLGQILVEISQSSRSRQNPFGFTFCALPLVLMDLAYFYFVQTTDISVDAETNLANARVLLVGWGCAASVFLPSAFLVCRSFWMERKKETCPCLAFRFAPSIALFAVFAQHTQLILRAYRMLAKV